MSGPEDGKSKETTIKKSIGSALIVEDLLNIRELMEAILKRRLNEEAVIIVAESGEEALEKLTNNSIKPDLIITDLRLKGISGIETLKKARALFGEDVGFNHVCLVSGTMDQTPEEQNFLNSIGAVCKIKGNPVTLIEEQIKLATEKLNQEPVTPPGD
ncbi:response regulator [Candidatus Beckwithbacteria bacterium]|nr:response regulator [Candidatus Beckwithbacteria bacterium]